jgi:septum formation protein
MLFKKICAEFEILGADIEEIYFSVKPHAVVKELARLKARAVYDTAADKENTIIAAADTIVWFDGAILGKPKDKSDAFDILKSLCGETHFVYTGVCFKCCAFEYAFYDKTKVKLRALSDDGIRAYIDEFNPLDKAGAYGVQDGVLVEGFKGCCDNIMGFPTEKTAAFIRKKGIDQLFL